MFTVQNQAISPDKKSEFSFVINFLFAFLLVVNSMTANERTVGLIEYHPTGQQEGYVLFAPVLSTTTYLIDKCGYLSHSWKSTYTPGFTASLLKDGSLLRSGVVENSFLNAPGGGGIIEKINWDGVVEWSYSISDSVVRQHHEILPMPNGNVLALVWERKTKDEALSYGRNPEKLDKELWTEKIIEIKPNGQNGGTVVWEWNLWDHLIQNFDSSKANFNTISEHPELIDINYTNNNNPKDLDWLHINGFDYNPTLDQIILSAHSLNEVLIIDHSTTTAEASTHSGGKANKGGDVLYRWGNPEAYKRGTVADKKLFGQHNPQWIASGLPDQGKILVFNNGMGRPGMFSSVEIFAPTVDNNGNYTLNPNEAYLPKVPEWIYKDTIPMNFFSFNQSGAQRLPNGNTLICASTTGTFFEITPDKKTVWKCICPVSYGKITKQGDAPSGNLTFRAGFYPVDFSGFNGRELKHEEPIELNPYTPDLCSIVSVQEEKETDTEVNVYPNPSGDLLHISFAAKEGNTYQTVLVNSLGTVVLSKNFQKAENDAINIDMSVIPIGTYILKVISQNSTSIKKVVIAR